MSTTVKQLPDLNPGHQRVIVDLGVRRRSLVTIAYPEGNPDVRGEGRTSEEALGNLIWVHGQKFGIDVVRID